MSTDLKKPLDNLYKRCNRRDMVHPDPLEFLYNYEDPEDREIVGLVAAALAYGRVKQILKSVAKALALIPSPAADLARAKPADLRRRYAGFNHRFTTGEQIADLLIGIRRTRGSFGSLLACFAGGLNPSDQHIIPGLSALVRELRGACGENCGGLLALPEDGSACKRMNLFLRWMVRRDKVDPGGWEIIGAERLIVPLDTHIGRIGRRLGFTRRNANDLRTALEITKGLAQYAPKDPAKYDFALSRLGIRTDLDEETFFAECGL